MKLGNDTDHRSVCLVITPVSFCPLMVGSRHPLPASGPPIAAPQERAPILDVEAKSATS